MTHGTSDHEPLVILARGDRAPRDLTPHAMTLRAHFRPALAVTLSVEGRDMNLPLRANQHGARIDLRSLPPAFAVDATLRVITSPWDADAWDLSPERSLRTLVLSLAGWRNDVWNDGPLTHILADGTVASYVPSGGDATLAIPRVLRLSTVGVALNAALNTEGSADERAHRCLVAALSSRLPVDQAEISMRGERYVAVDALAMALVKQARPDALLSLIVEGGARALTPAWRRFTENAGIAVTESGDGLPLSSFAEMVPAHLVGRLALVVNSISEVLPKSVLSQGIREVT